MKPLGSWLGFPVLEDPSVGPVEDAHFREPPLERDRLPGEILEPIFCQLHAGQTPVECWLTQGTVAVERECIFRSEGAGRQEN